MVIVFDAHEAETPDGKPVGVPIPVAPVVVWVIGLSAALMQTVGVDEAALTVICGLTTNTPDTLLVAVPQVPATTQ